MSGRIVLTLLCMGALSAWCQKKPFDLEALFKLQRLAEPQLSPDGKLVAFTVQTIDVEKNAKPRHIWIVPVEGGAPTQITRDGSVNERPRWMPDSKTLVFVSNRGGSAQIWQMKPDGSDAKPLTKLASEASGVVVAPDGKKLVFVSSVYPECGADDACNQRKIDEESKSQLKARVYTGLLYRHWNQFQGKRRSHLLALTLDNGAVKDLTPGTRDVPPFSLGGADDYAIAPDSGEVVFAMNADPDLALSTNSDLFVVPIDGGEVKKITTNPGADLSPQYSPDGKFLAYRSQKTAGYESDKWRLVVLERSSGRTDYLTEGLDRNVSGFTWTPDSKRLFLVVEDRGRHNIQMIQASGGGLRPIITGSTSVDDVQFTPDGKTIIYTEHSGARAAEIFKATSGGQGTPLTRFNESVFADYAVRPYEEISVEGAEKARVWSFVVKPPNFDPKKKHPVLFLIHGGPQGAWGESWGYRWNPHIFAGAGYVVVMPNPRGSTGYGQKFTDDINQDWGGKVYDDIMATVDYVAAQPWADADRFAAAGGSYGGYMVNWILGHSTRFKALVSHAGVFDLRSMAGETEEVWFPMWEFRGMPWDNPEVYQKWSPSYFVKDFKTPTLVLHGELDYRVPVGQGYQLFTGLQMMKVPSKMVLFPDEGHWIGKPQNTKLWYESFMDWIGEWTKKPAN
jgi:dipeptidyl aminopeptidase/acylaminoacyl peptidase